MDSELQSNNNVCLLSSLIFMNPVYWIYLLESSSRNIKFQMNAGSVRSWCVKLSPHSHICPERYEDLYQLTLQAEQNFQAYVQQQQQQYKYKYLQGCWMS